MTTPAPSAPKKRTTPDDDDLESDRPTKRPSSCTHLPQLPIEIAHLVFAHLTPMEIEKVRHVDGDWYDAGTSETIANRGGLSCVQIHPDYPSMSTKYLGVCTEIICVQPDIDDEMVIIEDDIAALANVIREVARKCPDLRVLQVPWRWRPYPRGTGMDLDDMTISAVGRACPRLTTLDVSNYRKVGDSSINTIALNCPELTRLTVNNCAYITDESIIAIARACRKLKKLEVRGCGFLTNTSILAIARHCRNLETLNVALIGGITAFSIVRVVSRCKKLVKLDVRNVLDLFSATLDEIRRTHPTLEISHEHW